MNPIINLTVDLVKIPSQGGIDDNSNILDFIYNWSISHKLIVNYLYNDKNEKVAVLIQVKGKKEGKHFCFDSCVDTAPFGDISKWSDHPLSAKIEDGYLYGRGSSDSKIATSIFLHIAKKLNEMDFNGQVDFLFDADEHTGGFSGAKAYLKHIDYKKIEGVFIGYPGNDEIVIGARGFYRTEITLHGNMEHSGSRKKTSTNSIVKAAKLIDLLNEFKFNDKEDPLFSFGPKISVTKINGGDGFSVIPSKCILNTDIRLTPEFNLTKARKTLLDLVNSVDNEYPSKSKSILTEVNSALPYRINANEYFINVLKNNAEKIFQKEINFSVCGPSNIGNLLYEYNINATCGFGVSYNGMHSIDERIKLGSIEAVYNVYYNTIRMLLD